MGCMRGRVSEDCSHCHSLYPVGQSEKALTMCPSEAERDCHVCETIELISADGRAADDGDSERTVHGRPRNGVLAVHCESETRERQRRESCPEMLVETAVCLRFCKRLAWLRPNEESVKNRKQILYDCRPGRRLGCLTRPLDV